MPKCKINGIEIEVKEGSKLIEAFKQADASIAHYCWHPALSVAGVCRLCMVEIEGNPRLQIACNTAVTEGMVATNRSEKVKEAVRWGLDFHLINHPLDCPICDQAGECGLQDQYMEFGKYTPEMAERKVKKHKVVSLGEKVVLDSERCILCSRCVRFTSEVTKTNELGIFNRGDRAEIGTFEDKPLNNNYSLNTVDICPVGALTAKDFRFRQRVWYLKSGNSICTGCSTGCNVKIYYNEEGLFRVKPEYNSEVNGYWMCDQGRDIYKYLNKPSRLEYVVVKDGANTKVETSTAKVLGEFGVIIRQAIQANFPGKVALVLTGQYSQEEYSALLNYFLADLGSREIYHWVNNPEKMEEFDGILFRGDRNPNTKGLQQLLAREKITGKWQDLEWKLKSKEIDILVVAGPENPGVFSDLDKKIEMFSQVKRLLWLSPAKFEALNRTSTPTWQIPVKSFFEKDGSYVNAKGKTQSVKKIASIVPEALSLVEVVTLLSGKNEVTKQDEDGLNWKKTNFFVHQRGPI